MDKAAIRACVKARRQLATRDEPAALLARLQMLASWRTAKHPCIYLALPDEAPTYDILKNCLARGLDVRVPRVAGKGRLTLHSLYCLDTLHPGAYGIPEPTADTPECTVADTDCVLVPGVAFDASGRRVGRGGGYYDRFLAQLAPHVPRIALAREWQFFPSLPAEAHDMQMDWILTAERITACAPDGHGHFQ